MEEHPLLNIKEERTPEQDMILLFGIARGMTQLHECGIVHGHLHDSIYVDSRDYPRIGNFSMTRDNANSSELENSKGIDVYSCGILFAEILNHQQYFGFRFSPGRRPPLPETVPPRLRQLINRMWEEDSSIRLRFSQVSMYLRDSSLWLKMNDSSKSNYESYLNDFVENDLFLTSEHRYSICESIHLANSKMNSVKNLNLKIDMKTTLINTIGKLSGSTNRQLLTHLDHCLTNDGYLIEPNGIPGLNHLVNVYCNNDWICEEFISRGSFGNLLKCRRKNLSENEQYAFKVIQPKETDPLVLNTINLYFLREVYSLMNIHHPAVVRLIGWNIHPYLMDEDDSTVSLGFILLFPYRFFHP
jgi:Tfp pilus assembly protein PilZ